MFQRILRWRGWAIALGLALAIGLAAPASAASSERNRAWQVASLLQIWWTELWPDKVTAPPTPQPPPTSPSMGGVMEIDRSSGIDPNGFKHLGSSRPAARHGQSECRPASWR